MADIIYGSSADDSLFGGDANDILNAGDGNDTLDGGAGSDTLIGGEGGDTYLLAAGAGQDEIHEWMWSGTDTVKLGAGISVGQVTLVRMGVDDLQIRLNGTGDLITVRGQFIMNAAGVGIEQIQFADGTIWGATEIAAAGYDLVGTAGDDVMIGGVRNDTLNGGAGNDVLNGGEGADTYVLAAGGGQDEIHDLWQSGPDIVQVAAGISASQITLARTGVDDLQIRLNGTGDVMTVRHQYDPASPGVGIEQIQFADGTTWGATEIAAAGYDLLGMASNDTLLGGTGNDTLDGGAGNDTLVGAQGNDTYVLAAGGGQDEIHDLWQSGPDIVQVAAGISASQITLARTGVDDLQIRLNGTGDVMTVRHQYDPASQGVGIEQIQFADGTIWGATEIAAAGYDLLGMASNDTLLGGTGNDTLDGGAGNDTLVGAQGNDTYVLAAGGGQDEIHDLWQSGPDIVQVAAGISASQITLARTGVDDLQIRLNGTGDVMTVRHQYDPASQGVGIEQIQFADGTTWGATELAAAAYDLVGTAGNDVFSGAAGNDTLSGAAGNDVLRGEAGNDQLRGGDGADVLVGGLGRDLMSGGAGKDLFDFNLATESGVTGLTWDTITDFVRGQDKIDLSTIDANSATASNEAFKGLISASKAFAAAGQLKFASGVLYGNTDTDADAEFAIQLSGVTALSNADFVL